MVKVAVEQPFTDIQQALQKKGYQADMIDQKTEGTSYDVVVVRNVESYEGISTEGSLVETSGRTVFEVVNEVEERLQRAGKIVTAKKSIKGAADAGGSGFTAGLLTGALVGAATALLLAPKSGKELQNTVKEKVASSGSGEGGSGKLSQVKEKAAGIAGQVKGQATGLTDKVSSKVTELKEKKQNKSTETTDTTSTSTAPTPTVVVTTDSLNTSSTTTGPGSTAGTSGAAGTPFGSGTSDTLDTSGTSGTAGGSGTSGTSGTTGTSGTSGTSSTSNNNKR